MRGCSSQNRLSISLPPVFPAYAGMFLGLSSEGSSTACFPRVCGDVPVRTTVRAAAAPFSPRMRGCSPALLLALSVSLRFPRVCGDVPSGSSLQSGAVKFSPRMRGCSQLHRPIPRSHHVFPAYAGMFPRLSFKPIWVGSFPRIRGDVPTRGFTEAARAAFSPHTRGCSEEDLEQAQCHLVFPAYARMFPTWATTTGTWKGFPRIRGDVSMFERHGLELAVFSPHTRGCWPLVSPLFGACGVFPAYAGMFLPTTTEVQPGMRFPRIRGDVPLQLPGQGAVLPFSPHTRGYSCECSTSGAGGAVFPACAGMFLVATAVTTLRQCFPRVRGDVLPVWL